MSRSPDASRADPTDPPRPLAGRSWARPATASGPWPWPGCSRRRRPGPPGTTRSRPGPPHFPAKAKRVISLFMHGGPSHLETFDPKPDLQRLAGQPLPASFGPVATRRKVAQNPLLATKRTFRKYGQSGIEVSDFLPAHRRAGRRPGRDPLVLGRQRQPPAGRLPDEHRLDLDGPAEPGELGRLRPGDREPRPPRLRRPARPRRRDQGRPARLRGRLPARRRTRGPWSGAARARSSTSARPTR